jgi:tocopherol cyclase
MYSLYKIFNPALFQGSLNKSNYFEGWYFKHVSANHQDSFTVIPGISLSTDTHAFIQFVDGSTGKSAYFRYDIRDFHAEKRTFKVRIGNSFFSSDGVGLDLENDEFKVNGKIDYSDMVTLRSTLLRPGIMGWYSYVPGMECNHGVVSLNHFLAGTIYIDGQKKILSGGKGYIEKDWGTSFPESWIWLQCNTFKDEYVSVMISAAKIPWRGSFFPGFVAFIYLKGKTEIFATYNGAKIMYLRKVSSQKSEILIVKGRKNLKAVISAREGAALSAPVDGKMINRIKESLSAKINIEYTDGNKVIFSGTGINSGFEETDGIFKYF